MVKSKQKHKQPSRSHGAPQTSQAVFEELHRLRKLRQQETDRQRRRQLAATHLKIQREFSSWKESLCSLIRSKSRISVHDDGSATYILPAELVRLVWRTTIAQRAALEASKDSGCSEEQASQRAILSLRDEMGELAKQLNPDLQSASTPHEQPIPGDG